MAGTVVYVDHAPDLPDGFVRALGRRGFRLQYTRDLDEAWALARDGAACLLLVEVLLEEGRGWQLVRRVRALEGRLGELPIVVLTRTAYSPRLQGRALELGADDFLSRPVSRSKLLDTIVECVSSAGADSPAASALAGATQPAAREETGSLAASPLPELLLQLRETRATGVLFLQDFEELAVELRDGVPVRVESNRGDEAFPDFLTRTKRISGEEHAALLERVHATGESPARAAVAIGAMSPAEARAATADRSVEPLLEAFAWSGGSWRFEPGQQPGSGLRMERDPLEVLIQGVLQWTPARSVRAMLDRRGALYVSRSDSALRALRRRSTLPCEPELLDRWRGRETVAQVLEAGVIGERELYALVAGGLVALGDRPGPARCDEVEPMLLTAESEIQEPEEPLGPVERVERVERVEAVEPETPRPRRPAAARPGLLARLRSWWRR